MSHEIRTPMNGIIGFSELIIQDDLLEENRKNYAGIVIESGKQLLTIVDDILDISKIEVGQLTLYKQAVSINDVISELFSFYSLKARELNLGLYPYKDLSDAQSVIVTDKQRLVQILNNLLSNAFKFTTYGSISFGYNLKGEFLEFYVQDTGPGIPKNMQELVFERFRQVEDPSLQKYRGTGLGLSISQKLVELLGGHIFLESHEKIGSKFYFTIPYNEKPIVQKNNVIKNESATIKFSKIITLLIVEDEEVNYLFLKELFNPDEYFIYRAKNGVEAIDYCKKYTDIDLILMDIKMPEMNGIEATIEIRKFKPEIPIIIQTAYAMDHDKELAFMAGATAFVSKPINKNNLFEQISKCLKY